MKIIYSVFILLIFKTSFVFTQNTISKPSVIVYTDNTPYLMSTIENFLKEIKTKSGEFYFDEVANIARIFDGISDEKTATRGRSELLNDEYLTLLSTDSARAKFTKRLSDFEYFLKINILPLEDLLEYQFILYDLVQKDKSYTGGGPFINSITANLQEPIHIESFFLNPRDSNYENILYNRVKKVFPATNRSPVGIITINGEEIIESEYTFPINTEVYLNSDQSFDVDDSKIALTYHWSINSAAEKSYQDSEGNFNPHSDFQFLNSDETVFYYVTLRVSDGISYSEKVELVVKFIENPVLYPETYNRKSILHGGGSETTPGAIVLEQVYGYESENTKVRIQRTNVPAQSYSISKLRYLFNKSGNLRKLSDELEYPDVLKIDTVITNGDKFNVYYTLNPFDASGITDYEFDVFLDYEGILSNKEKLYIKHKTTPLEIGNRYISQFNSRDYLLSNENDSRIYIDRFPNSLKSDRVNRFIDIVNTNYTFISLPINKNWEAELGGFGGAKYFKTESVELIRDPIFGDSLFKLEEIEWSGSGDLLSGVKLRYGAFGIGGYVYVAAGVFFIEPKTISRGVSYDDASLAGDFFRNQEDEFLLSISLPEKRSWYTTGEFNFGFHVFKKSNLGLHLNSGVGIGIWKNSIFYNYNLGVSLK